MSYRFYVQNILNEIEIAANNGAPKSFEPNDVQELYEHLCYLENQIIALTNETPHG